MKTGLRSRRARGAVLGLAAAASILLAGCGSNDVSESSDAGLTTAPSAADASGTNMTAATAPDETLQGVPSGFPGPARPEANPNGPEYLSELKKQELPYSGNGDNAISIGQYVCAATRDGISDDRIDVNVLAMASNELQLADSGFPPEDAAKIYIDSARKVLCS